MTGQPLVDFSHMQAQFQSILWNTKPHPNKRKRSDREHRHAINPRFPVPIGPESNKASRGRKRRKSHRSAVFADRRKRSGGGNF